jgi:hypothetical protein
MFEKELKHMCKDCKHRIHGCCINPEFGGWIDNSDPKLIPCTCDGVKGYEKLETPTSGPYGPM